MKLILKYSIGMVVLLNTACQREYVTLEDFAGQKKIDTHIHLNTTNTALAEQAVEDNFTLLAVSVDVPDYPTLKEQRECALYQQGKFPDQVKYLTAFTLKDWNSAGWAKATIAELDSSFASGALGIKLWKNIGMVYKDSADRFIMIDDPAFDPVINEVVRRGKTVMGHLGEPRNCWLPVEKMTVNNDREYFKNHPEYHMFLHPEYPSYEDQIDARDRFLERHPDMRFVGAHLGSLEWDVDELAKRLDKFPNMAVDMAERISHLQYQSMMNREKVRAFFIKYQDRLIYATDSGISNESDPENTRRELHQTWLDHWKYFVTDDQMTVVEVNGAFQGLKLPRSVVEKIYYHNAVHWFKM